MKRAFIFALLRVFLPSAALILGGSWLFHEMLVREAHTTVRQSEELSVSIGASALDLHLQDVILDVKYLANHDGLLLLKPGEKSKTSTDLETDFVNLLRAKPHYGRIRWIDASGQEILRAEATPVGPRLTQPSRLQDKSQRYFFKDTMALAPGEIYVSPLDLDGDTQETKMNPEPVLRVGTPVVDALGQKRGIVLINYRAQTLIDQFERVTKLTSDHIMLVNIDGFWLHHPDESKEFGFMRKRPDLSMTKQFPEAWKRMQGAEKGQFESTQGLWTFAMVKPLPAEARSSNGNPEITGPSTRRIAPDEYRWFVVAHLGKEHLAAGNTNDHIVAHGISLLLLTLFGIGAFALVSSDFRAKASQQLFQSYFDHAMVGMATTSPQKKWIAVNPALCQIFGYSQEELQRVTWPELTHPDDLAADLALFEQILRGETDGYALDKRFIHRDGHTIYAYITVQCVRKANRSIDYFVAIVEDVSQRFLADRERRQALSSLQGFIDHLPGTAYVKDRHSRVLVASKGFQTLLGMDPANMIGKLSQELFPGEFGEKIVADDKRVLSNGETEVIEERYGNRWFESTKFVIPTPDGGKLLGGITIDISRRHEATKALRESEERLRLLGDNLPDSYVCQYTYTEDGKPRFLHISSGVERLHGITAQTVLDNAGALFNLIDTAQIGELKAAERVSRENLSDYNLDVRTRMAGHKWGWIRLCSRPRRNDNANVIWDCVATDITTQKHNASILDLQARRASALLSLPEIAEKLPEDEFLQVAQEQAENLTDSRIAFIHFVNDDQESIELVAWSRGTLENYCQAVFDRHYPIGEAGIWANAARTGKPIVINDYFTAPDKRGLPEGHARLERLISTPVTEGGKVRMIAGVGNKPTPYSDLDVETVQLIANECWRIVRKHRAEEALHRANQVVAASAMVCFRRRAAPDWLVEYVSDNVSMWGYTAEELCSSAPPFSSLIHPEDLARIAEEAARFTAAGLAKYQQEYRVVTRSGETIWVLDLTTVHRNADGVAEFYDSVIADISERKHREQLLAESLAAMSLLNKQLEEAHNQLLQSEKLASIGQLAAGVAHEINNPIGFVASNLGSLDEYMRDLIRIIDACTDVLSMQGPKCPQLQTIHRIMDECDYDYLRKDIFELVEESKDGIDRVKQIVQDLRTFSRVGETNWQWADLHKGLDSTLNIIWNELKYKCKVHKEYGDLPEVYCLISQLNQVFMNLLVNAGHAIETQGEITIRTALVGSDSVSVEISDNGAGIQPDNLNRIFDPFFTTKPIGQGTGLGLSLAYSMVNKHQGRIDVKSIAGKGTCFTIILPIRPSEAPEEALSQ